MRQCRADWLRDLADESQGAPVISIPAGLNMKTPGRDVPIPLQLARLLRSWMFSNKALQNNQGDRWPEKPFSQQPGDALLFPGWTKQRRKTANKAISEKAYYDRIRKAADSLAKERARARRAGQDHPFEHFDLSKLATHSTKKTAVSLLKEQRHSTAIISALTGTSSRTLESVYDMPTCKRVRSASNQALSPVLEDLACERQERSCCGVAHDSTANFCYLCGGKL